MKTLEYYEIQYRYAPETGGCNGWQLLPAGNFPLESIVLVNGIGNIETARFLIDIWTMKKTGAEYRIVKVKMTLEKEVVE